MSDKLHKPANYRRRRCRSVVMREKWRHEWGSDTSGIAYEEWLETRLEEAYGVIWHVLADLDVLGVISSCAEKDVRGLVQLRMQAWTERDFQ